MSGPEEQEEFAEKEVEENDDVAEDPVAARPARRDVEDVVDERDDVADQTRKRKPDARSGPADRRVRGSDESWLSRIFGLNDKLYGQSANQYLIALKATSLSLDQGRTPANSHIWCEVDRIIAKYPDDSVIKDDQAAWDDANRCERLLVNLYDSTRLDVELDRRILEAEQMKLDFASFYTGRRMKPKADQTALTEDQEKANRSLLSRLIEDQQWHNTKLYLKRGYAHTAQMRVSMAFLFALLLFGATLTVVFETSGALFSIKKEDAQEGGEPNLPPPAPQADGGPVQ